MVKLVIGLLGEIGGGKTVLANFLKNKHGACSISSGQIVRNELASEGLEVTREACQRRGGEKGREDKGYWVRKIISAIEDSGSEIGIFDGTRFPHDVSLLREYFGDNYIAIHVTADQRVRYGRLVARGRKDAPASFEDFVKQEEGEYAQFSFDTTKGLADIRFENTANFDINNGEGLYQEFIGFLRDVAKVDYNFES